MPIDPRIPLMAEMPKINTPFENLDMVMQAQQRQAQAREMQRKEREAARLEQERQAVTAILQQTNGDWEAALPRIRQIAPNASLEFEKKLNDERKSRADAIKSELDTDVKLTDKWLGRLRGLPEGDDELYQMYRQQIRKEMPDLGEMLPPQYDKTRIAQIQQVGLTAKEHADLQRQALEFAAKGEWRQSTGAALATATSAEDWEEIKNGQHELGAPAAVLRQFGPWSPDAPQRAARMGMTAAQQSAEDSAAAGRAVTVRGQDMAAASQAANRQVMMRGQNMADARAKATASGGSTAERAQLIEAVMANPALYADLTPSVKSSIAGELNKRGFKFAAAGTKALQLSAGQQQDLEAMLTISDTAKEIRTIGDRSGWSGTGAFGAGTLGNLKAKIGVDSADNMSLRNKINNMRAAIAKMRGGTAFTPNEQALLDSYTPHINDGDSTLRQKLVDLESFIDTKRKNMLKIASGDLSPNTTEPPPNTRRNPFRK